MPIPAALALIPIIQALGIVGAGETSKRGAERRRSEEDVKQQERADLAKAFEIFGANPTAFMAPPGGAPTSRVPGEVTDAATGIPLPMVGDTPLAQLFRSLRPEWMAGQREAEETARQAEIGKNRMASALYAMGPETLKTLGLDELLGQILPGASGVREAGKGRTFATEERLGGEKFTGGENALDRALQLEIAGMPARGGAQAEDPSVKRIFAAIKDVEDTIGDTVTKIGDDPRSVTIGRSVINKKNYELYSALRDAKAMGGNPEAVAKRFARSATLISDPRGMLGAAGGMPVSLFRALTMPQDQQAKYGGYPELAALYYDLLGEQAPVETSPVPGRGQTGSSYFSGQGASEQQMLEMIRSSEEAAGLDE